VVFVETALNFAGLVDHSVNMQEEAEIGGRSLQSASSSRVQKLFGGGGGGSGGGLQVIVRAVINDHHHCQLYCPLLSLEHVHQAGSEQIHSCTGCCAK